MLKYGNKWTEEEIFLLGTMHGQPKDVIAKALGRTESAVTGKIWNLKNPGTVKKRPYRPWTDDEVALLKELFPKTRTKDIRIYGRSRQAIGNKANELGLKKEGIKNEQH